MGIVKDKTPLSVTSYDYYEGVRAGRDGWSPGAYRLPERSESRNRSGPGQADVLREDLGRDVHGQAG